MTPDKIAPLMGLSAGLLLAFGSLVVFCLLLSALVPLTLLALRKQSQQQLEVLRRIEQRLGVASPPPGGSGTGMPPLPTSGAQPDPADVN
jgi:hypothetical protein